MRVCVWVWMNLSFRYECLSQDKTSHHVSVCLGLDEHDFQVREFESRQIFTSCECVWVGMNLTFRYGYLSQDKTSDRVTVRLGWDELDF